MPRARGRRVATTVAALALLVGAVWISSAFACTNLATISLSSGFGHPGDRITLIGTSFPVPRATSTTPPTPVVVRWKSIDGPIIANAVPDRTGTISTTFTVPQSDPGNVVIVAVQRRPVIDPAQPDAPPATYIDEAGTPARATFRILANGEFAPTSVPFSPVLATGEGDAFVENNRYLSGALWSRGIGNALRIWDGWCHDWPWWKDRDGDPAGVRVLNGSYRLSAISHRSGAFARALAPRGRCRSRPCRSR